MEENQSFEERYALWKESYEQYLQLMEAFYRSMESYRYHLAIDDEARQQLQDSRESLMRKIRERRANRPLPPHYRQIIYFTLLLEYMSIAKKQCKRCGHKWTPNQEVIIVCPKCKSPYWNKDRKRV